MSVLFVVSFLVFTSSFVTGHLKQSAPNSSNTGHTPLVPSNSYNTGHTPLVPSNSYNTDHTSLVASNTCNASLTTPSSSYVRKNSIRNLKGNEVAVSRCALLHVEIYIHLWRIPLRYVVKGILVKAKL